MCLRFKLFICVLIYPGVVFAVDKKEDKKDSAAASAPATSPDAHSTSSPAQCTQSISYSWKRLPPKEESPDLAGKKPPKAPTPDPEIYGVNEIAAFTRSETGASEAEVKDKLASSTATALAHARELCRKEHENTGDCVAGKLAAQQMDRLDFETRRLIREQIVHDCLTQSGLCLSTKEGEITCSALQKVETEASPPAEAAKDTKKK